MRALCQPRSNAVAKCFGMLHISRLCPLLQMFKDSDLCSQPLTHPCVSKGQVLNLFPPPTPLVHIYSQRCSPSFMHAHETHTEPEMGNVRQTFIGLGPIQIICELISRHYISSSAMSSETCSFSMACLINAVSPDEGCRSSA